MILCFLWKKGKNSRKHRNNVVKINKLELLKTAVIFGGNANGKTNVILGLKQLISLVLLPTMNEQQKISSDTLLIRKDM